MTEYEVLIHWSFLVENVFILPQIQTRHTQKSTQDTFVEIKNMFLLFLMETRPIYNTYL